MKTIYVTIAGITPLLINRFKEQDEIPAKVTKGKKDYGTPREQAEATAYRDDEGKLWVPGDWISGTLKSIASDYKINGMRKSAKSVIGGAVVPVDEVIYFNEKYTLGDIEVDSRPVVIQGKDRIMRHRARLEEWSLSFELELDETIFPVEQLYGMLVDAGRRAGLGDYRPPKGGRYGRFIVSNWEVETGRDWEEVVAEKMDQLKKRGIEVSLPSYAFVSTPPEESAAPPKRRGRKTNAELAALAAAEEAAAEPTPKKRARSI